MFDAFHSFLTYGCRSKIDGSPCPPPDYPAPPARMRSSPDHRSCCEHTQEGRNVKAAISCHYLQDVTGAPGRGSNQNVTTTPYLSTAAALQYWEKPLISHRAERKISSVYHWGYVYLGCFLPVECSQQNLLSRAHIFTKYDLGVFNKSNKKEKWKLKGEVAHIWPKAVQEDLHLKGGFSEYPTVGADPSP